MSGESGSLPRHSYRAWLTVIGGVRCAACRWAGERETTVPAGTRCGGCGEVIRDG